jgi:hypothetical protein
MTDARRRGTYAPYMTFPFTAPGRWVADHRGEGRGVRVSAHAEGGFLVLSTWKADKCVATVRLLPDEAALLVAGITESLASFARQVTVDDADLADRVALVEARLAAVEHRE